MHLSEDWSVMVRAALGVLTCGLVMIVQDGRMHDDRHFWAVLVSLIIVAVLAADVKPLESFQEQVNTLQGIPWTVYSALAPGLEKLTSVIRGDAGATDVPNTDLTVDLYSGNENTDDVKNKDGKIDPDKLAAKKVAYAQDAPTLHGSDGKLDTKKFNEMKLSYKQIVTLLCRMKTIAPVSHDALVTAIGGCG